jgi:arsenate reductase-like glutaredoxin family protein
MAEIAHAERAHALLSASASHRWLTCTPSVRLEEQFPDSTSEFAEEGTLAHEIAELKLRKYFTEPMSQKTFNTRLNKMKKHSLYQEEMQKHTDTYLDYLQGITLGMAFKPYVAVEKKIDYAAYAPEGFGTGDCIIIGGDTLYVTDFKYGKGVAVSAIDNPQMKLYALGAYREYSFLYPITKIHMAIIQPRLDSISEYTISLEELLAWGEEIKPIAQKAFNGEGEYAPGEHCKFCKAKAQCRARAEQYSALEDFKMLKPPLISDEEIGQILERAEHIEAWVKALKEYALAQCLKGNDIPGWKAVEGRGSRSYIDQDVAFAYLKENGVEEALLYERVPLTVAKIEKVLKKADFRSLLEEPGHVVKTPGKPTLAPIADKRISIAPNAAVDFQVGG